MNLLLVTAHPDTGSFNFAMRERAQTVARRLGLGLQHSDLYQQGFSPVPGRADFRAFPEAQLLQLGSAQREAARHGGFAADIAAEQDKLRWADAVLLQFPLWWSGYPAMLKGWIERVLSLGFAYGPDPTLEPRALIMALTTGGAADAEDARATEAHVRSQLAQPVFGYMGWGAPRLHLVHGPARLSEAERVQALQHYEQWLEAELQTLRASAR
ncbi:NAD(P)H-dependent oxidoreductase [Kinneretia aquatilis]|uniref:NAD(P)H-dependent oxidoreductase n=1 Tax=Kinneretia aquatilis TaxID=2070761 RepID=UPI0014952F08|nr:NAD(P)H-dependent oxidoreductase [Paucibacter aquatile]WIV98099.1 NAD(P)H-dependent oxidoreductase [Paucibacter aquatile]